MPIPNLDFVELIGYVASVLVFSTFYMKTMIPLRTVAIVSNVTFITYAYFAGLTPVFILHLSLLPLNIVRLVQMRRLLARVQKASRGKFSIQPLLPFMNRAEAKAGEVLFRQGDTADRLYYVISGSIAFPEIEATAGEGEIIGEIGVFSAEKARTSSAIAESDCSLLTLSDEKVLELYFQNPEFGFHLVRMIIQHMIHQVRVGRAAGQAAAQKPAD